jgi:hypothetical protein
MKKTVKVYIIFIENLFERDYLENPIRNITIGLHVLDWEVGGTGSGVVSFGGRWFVILSIFSFWYRNYWGGWLVGWLDGWLVGWVGG